ncbi:hypothetical protein Sa4125_22920 [Aureimonas sp. SA4125]|uniref:putative baseplate assembly protein n=1 Tax=Aureimonas sp. SA4125 TaxID=2826993 RepID=UPI001CC41095|nr:putative baseplate assembly protein [Aureimonas sp. SA4125]BDA84750.1 hypothetical protein Sa4125_22920 [Aureimonas sp. SA4125]
MSEIIVGDARLPAGEGSCGCCSGTGASLPTPRSNAPGQRAIAYRVGTHSAFKATMLARLSAREFKALSGLRTRDDDDPSIALLDAFATTADVLSFYQERIANESFLSTATEAFSVAALARLIGYRLNPGVAASVDLAFTMEPAPGAPEMAVAVTTIPAGTKVQSVPGPGERSQTYETLEDIEGRVAWNALKPQQMVTHRLRRDDRIAFLKGAAVRIAVGDVVLLVGPERIAAPGDEHWDLRIVVSVERDVEADRTTITFDRGLGVWVPDSPPSIDPTLYVMRRHAALFGHNALHPSVLHPDVAANVVGIGKKGDWDFKIEDETIYLDAPVPGVVPGSWVVLTRAAYTELYRVVAVAETGKSGYLMSGRTSALVLDTDENLTKFDGADYRRTAVLTENESLDLARAPIVEPVWGDDIVLDGPVEGLSPGRRLVVRGRAPRVRADGALALVDAQGDEFKPGDGERLSVVGPPVEVSPGLLRWRLRTSEGREGTLDRAVNAAPLRFVAAGRDDPVIAEVAILGSLDATDPIHGRLILERSLIHAYDRGSAEVLANVAPASHGESVTDILGNGDASRPNQRFALRQGPLTHVRSPAGGSASTLTVRVSDVAWTEVPDLLGSGPRDRVYTTRLEDDGTTVVAFGDGVTGARPPTSRDSIVASYRKGIGLGGLATAGQITLLAARPLGVKSVTNPLAAEGAQDPERVEDTRRNAPTSVLTLGRAVSLTDYEDYARTYPGVGKARADLLWRAGGRRIVITVAGPDGRAVQAGGDLTLGLLRAVRRHGDPNVAVEVVPYRPVAARARIRVKIASDRRPDDVLPAVAAALQEAFGFARRFAQPLFLSEVISVASAVPGVVAVNVTALYRSVPPLETPVRQASLPAASAEILDGVAVGAEHLTLSALEELEAMP